MSRNVKDEADPFQSIVYLAVFGGAVLGGVAFGFVLVAVEKVVRAVRG